MFCAGKLTLNLINMQIYVVLVVHPWVLLWMFAMSSLHFPRSLGNVVMFHLYRSIPLGMM